MNGLAIKAALTKTLLLSVMLNCAPGYCQNPFNDNQTWSSQPPGAFLNNKAKPATTAKKTAAKPAPLKPNVQGAQTFSRNGGNQSSGGDRTYSVNQPNGDFPPMNQQSGQSSQQMGQSDWQQNGIVRLKNSQMGSSDWVSPANDGFNDDTPQSQSNQDSQGQGWVTNQSGGSNSQMGQSGWNTPGQSSQNQQQSSNGIGQSEWVSPGGSNNNNGGGQMQSRPTGAFSNQSNQTPGFPPINQSSNGIGQSGWNSPGSGGDNNNNNDNSPPPFPQSSFQQSGSTGGSFGTTSGGAPSFGAVLEQEQLQGGAQINSNGSGMGGGMVNNMNNGAGGMPAFNQSAAAGVLPSIMNFMQQVMPQKGATFNPNVGTSNMGGATVPMSSGTGAVFVPQQQVQKAPSQPFQTPRIVKQVGKQVNRTVNRAVNRSVNQMLYRGVNSLRF